MKSFLTSFAYIAIALFIIVSFISWDITTLAHEGNTAGRIAFLFFTAFFSVISEVIKEDIKEDKKLKR